MREETINRAFAALAEAVPALAPAPAPQEDLPTADNALPHDGGHNHVPPVQHPSGEPLRLVPATAPEPAADTSAAARHIADVLQADTSDRAPGELLVEALLIHLFEHCAPSSKPEADTLLLATAEPLVRELLILADDTDAGGIGLLALALAPFSK